MCPEKIVVFGITGSIGLNTEKLISAFSEKFELIGASAGNNIESLKGIINIHKELQAVAISRTEDREKLSFFSGTVFSTENELIRLLDLNPDKIVMALPGKQGWKITVEAIKRGIPVCLANKESPVIAGFYLGSGITSDRQRIIPIDSEHAALMQLLEKSDASKIKKVYLTASGGALRDMTAEKMKNADAAKALNHPVWSMGKKVTVDSATMLNKGLELIEAYWLFNIEPEKLDVLIHPTIDVHAMVTFIDGSAISQNAVSSMLVPIATALSYPEMLPVTEKFPEMEFRFEHKDMKFTPPDLIKYPLLAKAFDLLKNKDLSGMVAYAVSDEVAVEKFLRNEINIDGIHRIVLRSVEKFSKRTAPSSAQEIAEFINEIEEFAKEVI